MPPTGGVARQGGGEAPPGSPGPHPPGAPGPGAPGPHPPAVPGPHAPAVPEQLQFAGPERRERRDRRAGIDRRTGQRDRRLLRRERRRADRRSGTERRDEAGIVLTEATERGAGVPLAPVSAPGGAVFRRRRRAAALLVALLLAVAVAVVLALSLTLEGGSGPADAAASVVPADALALVHVSTDPARPATRAGLHLAERFPDYPLISALVEQRLGQLLSGGRLVSFTGQIRPWLGREAALAVLPASGSVADTLLVLDVRRPVTARSFLDRQGAAVRGVYRGVTLLSFPSGSELAFVSHFLVLGQPASVQAAIDVTRGAAPSLAAAGAYAAATRDEPQDRFLDAYASPAGVRQLLAGRTGLEGTLGVLLDSPALSGVSLSVSAKGAGAQMTIHRALDPTLVKLTRSSTASFAPSLQSLVPASALGVVELNGLGHTAGRLLGLGSASRAGGQIGSLVSRLGTGLASEGIDVGQITKLFDRQTAVALLSPLSGGSPSLVLLTRSENPTRDRTTLAALEAPLAQLFPPPGSGPGKAATFSDVIVDGSLVHQLALNPGLQIDYAVIRNLVVVSTSLDGIRQIIRPHRPLADTGAFTQAFADRPAKITSLLFLDLSQLLSIGEQSGLLRSVQRSALHKDLLQIRTVALTSTGGEAETTAELSLQIP
jgi:hypothetical protein